MNKYFEFFEGIPGSFVLTALLSLLALCFALYYRTPARWLIFAAMLMSSAGDFALMTDFTGIFKNLPFPRLYLGGLIFAASHILYIAAFATLIKKNRYDFVNAGFIIGAVICVVVMTFILAFYFRNNINNPTLFAIAVFYILVICSACTVILSYGFSAGGRHWLTVIGSLSFLISDFIIGLGVMSVTEKFDWLIWWFYPIGQILMIIGG